MQMLGRLSKREIKKIVKDYNGQFSNELHLFLKELPLYTYRDAIKKLITNVRLHGWNNEAIQAAHQGILLARKKKNG